MIWNIDIIASILIGIFDVLVIKVCNQKNDSIKQSNPYL